MRSGERRAMSAPAKRMVPARAGSRPIRVRMVVVLPMPLRPMRVTSWPGAMASEMSWSTWLWP